MTTQQELADLSKRCGLPEGLSGVGITADDLPLLAKDAMNQTRLLVNNPREVTLADAGADAYRRLLEAKN